MTCPRCQKPLWRAYSKAVLNPKDGIAKTQCSHCVQTAHIELPPLLGATAYQMLGGVLLGSMLLALATLDVAVAVKAQLIFSALFLMVGLIALLTWTQARVK